MKRSLIALALLVASLPGAARDTFDRASFMRIAMSMVRVEALAPDHHYNMGSGVIVGPGRVVTSCHVTGPAPSIRVLYGGLRYEVKLQRADVHHDLCMLDVPEINGPPAVIGSTGAVRLGDPVIAMGFTGGYELQFADGTVRGMYPEHGLPILKASTAFNSGASGGGLFAADGSLVGILTFRLRGAEDCYYSMPVDWIRAWIASPDGFETPHLLDQQKPVWLDPLEHQPEFLQAAALEAGKQWGDLERLAAGWLVREPESPDAWFAAGKAALAMDHLQLAGHDFEQATSRQPRLAEAWLALARVYTALHREEDSQQARTRLVELDPALSEQLPPSTTAAP